MGDEPERPGWVLAEHHLQVARRAIAAHGLRTPLVPARALEAGAGATWLKVEGVQPTGSFKVRGALTRLSALSDTERGRGVIAASAGNHGAGVAFAAARLGVPAKIFVPATAPAVKQQKMLRWGATLERVPTAGYDAAEAAAREAAEANGALFVSPYDDPYVAAGNGATMAEEIFEQLGEASQELEVILPVGGGGLLAGFAAAAERSGRRCRLVGVQSDRSAAMTRSLEEGRAYESWPAATTFADGLEGGVCAASVRRARASGVAMHLVSEAEIAAAMRFAHHELGLKLEGSAAVPIAWCLKRGSATAGDGSRPRVLLLTGANVDEAVWQAVLAGNDHPR